MPPGTGPLSSDIIVSVGCAPPAAPTGLTYQLPSPGTVRVSWSPPDGGAPPASYLLSAGTQEGREDLLSIDVGASTVVAGNAPRGRYFVRVKARNACGIGAA